MGQRHQVYLIARITPHGNPLGETRYRCIAALHHQWCYGRLPLKAATRCITLIRQKENAEIIREEINNIHGLYGSFGTNPKLPTVPCPFTHFLMHSAWTSDLNGPGEYYESSGRVLPAGMGTTQGDNNDGITIIDVSDPESPAYCFVSVYGLECEDMSNIPTMTPLSATQYVRGYYPKVEIDDSDTPESQRQKRLEQSVLDTLRPFESVPMITIDMLAEAWPGEYTPDEPNPPKESGATASIHMPPSLVELTFVPALNYALQTGETDCLDPFMLQPGNVSKIKETLRGHNPISAIGFALLSKVIALEVTQTKSIDLSHFSLTGEQLIELLSAHEGVEVLNISHMQQITTDNLRRLIPILPNLRRLVLLHTIPEVNFLSLLSESPELFYHIDSVVHFTFLCHLGQASFHGVFSHITIKESKVSIASLPYFTPGQLVQALTDYLSIIRARDNYSFLTSMDNELPLLATYASAVREPGRSWSERIVPFIPHKPNTLNEHKGWFFAWSEPDPFIKSRSYCYAFFKINKEVMEECQRKIDEFRRSFPSTLDALQNSEGQAAGESDAKMDDNSGAKTSLSYQELQAKEKDIKSEYTDRQFHVFDAKSFFQELVKEGRPAPSPEALTKLLEIFAALEEKDDPLCAMTPTNLTSFLEKTRMVQERLRFF